MSLGLAQTELVIQPATSALAVLAQATPVGTRASNKGANLSSWGDVVAAEASATLVAVPAAAPEPCFRQYGVALGTDHESSGVVVFSVANGQGAGDGAPLQRIVKHQFRIQPLTNALSRYWVGLIQDTVAVHSGLDTMNVDPANLSIFAVAFFVNLVSGSGTWKAVVGKSGGVSVVDTSIPVNFAHSVLGEIIPSPDLTAIRFYLNGVQVALVNQNIPLTTTFAGVASTDNVGTAGTPLFNFAHMVNFIK